MMNISIYSTWSTWTEDGFTAETKTHHCLNLIQLIKIVLITSFTHWLKHSNLPMESFKQIKKFANIMTNNILPMPWQQYSWD